MDPIRMAAAAALLGLLILPAPLLSQRSAPTPPPRDQKKEAVKFKPWLSLEGEYDGNVFLLSPGRKGALEDRTAADLTSGRFTGMESADDLIVQARAGIGIQADGLGGRTLTFSPAIQYDHYTKNSERSHVSASAVVSQALARGMRTRLEASYTPSYFAKNYLAAATDANGDGRIAPSERRYARAEYSAMDIELAHRLRLRRSTKRSPLGMELEVGAGYYSRSYDEPFAGRELSGPAFRTTFDVVPGRRVDFTLGYDLEILSADEVQEVLILDEAAAGRDLNANGNATDLEVRTVQLVDRSRREHELSAGARFAVASRTDFRVGYGLRLRNYSSEQPLDIGHRDRRDTRHELRADVSTRVARGLRFTTGARYARQTTNRAFDTDQIDEAADYTRLRGFVGLRWEF